MSPKIHITLNDICGTFEIASKSFVYFSPEFDFDETMDIVDALQLAVFVRGVNSKMIVTEELLDAVSVNGSTTGKNIKEGKIKCLKGHQPDLKNFSWHRNRRSTVDDRESFWGCYFDFEIYGGFGRMFKLLKGNIHVLLFSTPGKRKRASIGYVPRCDRCSQHC